MGRHAQTRTAGTRNPWRIALLALLAVAAAATLAGLGTLWPSSSVKDHASPEFAAISSFNGEHPLGLVTKTDDRLCKSSITGTVFDEAPLLPAGKEEIECHRALIAIQSGPDEGRMTQLVHYGVAGEPVLNEGDEIRLSRSAEGQYSFNDYQRDSALTKWAIIVGIIVLAFALWHGLRAMLGLGLSLGVVFFFLLPALAEGVSPMLAAVVSCSAIVILAVPVVHGVNWKAASAVAGSLITLGIAAFCARWTLEDSVLQGLSSDDNLKLALYLPSVSIVGVLLCGFIIGALGGLNDVAISQASTVNELAELDTEARPLQLFTSAMKVGRDHIASMVYTLVLTYAGAALPLMLLLSAASQPLPATLTSDLVATELLRSLLGALALTLAVPITTAIAAVTVPKR